MAHRTLLTIATIVAVAAVGGIGFAQFTSTAYINAMGAAGTFGPLSWNYEYAYVYAPVSGVNVCSAAVGQTVTAGDTLYLNATNMGPGDECGFYAYLYNWGSLPGTVTQGAVTATGGGCTDFAFADSALSSAPIGASGSSPTYYWATVSLSSSPVGVPGESCSYAITVTGTAL